MINLIDFKSNIDGPYYWIIQIKDYFSRYIWLEEIINKEATTIADVMKHWVGVNGRPY
jgi:hypothetical protein